MCCKVVHGELAFRVVEEFTKCISLPFDHAKLPHASCFSCSCLTFDILSKLLVLCDVLVHAQLWRCALLKKSSILSPYLSSFLRKIDKAFQFSIQLYSYT